MSRKRGKVPPSSEDPVLFECPPAQPSEPEGRRLQHPVWTENKARLIERYLYYFVFITHHGCYIDGFAGPQSAETPESWAAELVLNSRPAWLREFHLCEINRNSYHRLEQLRASYVQANPKQRSRRGVHLYHGDINVLIPQILSRVGPKEATFCLLDQRTFECRWSTVQRIASHRSEGHKIELFYFLGTSWLHRYLAAQQDTTVLDHWWGGDGWQQLPGCGAWDLALTFQSRFRDELGYWSAKPYPIYASEGSDKIMYFMVHATDHPEAPSLMARAYDKAVGPREPLHEIRQLRLEGMEAWTKSPLGGASG